MRRGINSPADFWANAKTFECERFWVNAKTFDYERFWVSPRVRQGLKTLSHSESPLKEDWDDDDLIGFTSRFQPTFAMRRGINSPADLWANARVRSIC